MSKDDDYVYSYIERKMINTKNKHSFDSKKHKSNTDNKDNKISPFGAVMFGVMIGVTVLSYIIIKDISKDNADLVSTKSLKSTLSTNKDRKVESMSEFLDTASKISKETNAILTNIVSVYTNKDFSDSTKKKLEDDLSKLSNYDLNQFKEEEYNMFKGKLEEYINITKNSVEYYSILRGQTKEASEYLNKLIDKKRNLDTSYTEDVKDTIIKAGLDYEILSDGRIKFY